VTERAGDSLGTRWDHLIEEWGLEAWFGVIALTVVLIFVLSDAWWRVVSIILGASLSLSLGVRVVRLFVRVIATATEHVPMGGLVSRAPH
jgi:hypothetical protein